MKTIEKYKGYTIVEKEKKDWTDTQYAIKELYFKEPKLEPYSTGHTTNFLKHWLNEYLKQKRRIDKLLREIKPIAIYNKPKNSITETKSFVLRIQHKGIIRVGEDKGLLFIQFNVYDKSKKDYNDWSINFDSKGKVKVFGLLHPTVVTGRSWIYKWGE